MTKRQFGFIRQYCEVVCKKASEEGWELRLRSSFYQWKKGTELFGEQIFFQNVVEALHQACVGLEKKNNWNFEVEIK